MMKNYTAKEAIELARENPQLVFIDREGKRYETIGQWHPNSRAAHGIIEYEPFTAHRLVPVDTPDIGDVLDELDDFIEEKAIWKDDYQYIPERSLYRELQKLRKKHGVKE